MKNNNIFWVKIKYLWKKYNQFPKLYTRKELHKMLDDIICNSKEEQ